MFKGLMFKFQQNPHLYHHLMHAKAILVEASPYDRFFGIGLAKTHPLATDMSAWPGLNLMGTLLARVRGELIWRKGTDYHSLPQVLLLGDSLLHNLPIYTHHKTTLEGCMTDYLEVGRHVLDNGKAFKVVVSVNPQITVDGLEELARNHPRVQELIRESTHVVILAGTNNIIKNDDLGHVMQCFHQLLQTVQAFNPSAQVLTHAVPPRADDHEPQIRELNGRMFHELREKHLRHQMIRRQKPIPGLLQDSAHLSEKGRRYLLQSLLRKLV